MPVEASWDNQEHTVILLSLTGTTWGWEEYYPAIKQVITMMEGVDNQVDVIVHLQTNFIPARPLGQLGPASSYIRHHKTRQVVLVGVHSYLRMLVDIFGRLYRDTAKKLQFASTLDDARTMLGEQRHEVG